MYFTQQRFSTLKHRIRPAHARVGPSRRLPCSYMFTRCASADLELVRCIIARCPHRWDCARFKAALNEDGKQGGNARCSTLRRDACGSCCAPGMRSASAYPHRCNWRHNASAWVCCKPDPSLVLRRVAGGAYPDALLVPSWKNMANNLALMLGIYILVYILVSRCICTFYEVKRML